MIHRIPSSDDFTEDRVKSLFILAGIEVLRVKPLPDGYNYSPNDPRYFETLPQQVWWFVKTPYGWIEIGWRKRVVAIEWSDTWLRTVVTKDAVTKSETGVHAYSIEDALKYLRALKTFADLEQAKMEPEHV